MDSFKMIEQKFKTCEGKILRLEQIEQFCISKNMALILYVFRIRPCFWKCKILLLERVLEFSPRQVKLQTWIFFRISSFFSYFFRLCSLPFMLQYDMCNKKLKYSYKILVNWKSKRYFISVQYMLPLIYIQIQS